MASCLGCGGLQPEAKLLHDCYPPSKALATAGPDFKPLSSDLSKLTYRCTNQSSKLAKVGEELDKRVAKEAVKSTGGYAKSRASLLISLAILRALISECRRDLSLFSRSTIRIIHSALNVKVYQKGGPDLEVLGRAASCFIAFTTYADGVSVGVDDSITSTYLSVLGKFAQLAIATGSDSTTSTSSSEKPDTENQNRMRLIGLAALHGASSSDALFSGNAEFPRQVGIVVPALLTNIFQGDMAHVKLETAKIEMDASPSPFFTEFFASRPVNDRRAPSLHAHIPGEKGPADTDVLSAALRSLHALVRQCQVNQASHVLDAVFTFLDRIGWNDAERCCWIAERLTGFMMLQYRFVVPTRLVEALVDLEDCNPTVKHMTNLAMVTTVLNSSISLVGLGVTDLLNNLITLIVRRIHFEPTDGLLPPLVQCISSLGTHIYYADQINDVVEEIALRIAAVPQGDAARPEIVRVLIYAITGIMTTAVVADAVEARATTHQDQSNVDKGKVPAIDTPASEAPRRSTDRRNPVTVEIWQETLPLLCEATYAVRAAYARALVLFIVNELPRERTPHRPTDVATYRFCNAVHAAIYTLAMSSCLGSGTPEPSLVSARGSFVVTSIEPKPDGTVLAAEPAAMANNDANTADRALSGFSTRPSDKGVSFNLAEPTPDPTPGDTSNGANTPNKSKHRRASRRVSLPFNRVNSSLVLTSFENVATPFDFAAIIKILDELHAAVPVAALMTSVPMLFALDRDAGCELVRRPNDGRQDAWILERKRAIKEVVSITWRRLADRWGLTSIVELANKTINSLPEPFEVPDPAPAPPGILPPPEEPTQFVSNTIEGESSTGVQPLLDPDVLISNLVASTTILSSSHSDALALVSKFTNKWTVENALKDSVERFYSAPLKPVDDDTHFEVANVLMSLNNPSFQSFGRPQNRSVDVTDLREALGGRVDSLPNSSHGSVISTTGGRSFAGDTSSPKRRAVTTNTDVQEVLKDIFKGKKKRGGQGVKKMGLGLGTGVSGGGGRGGSGARGSGSGMLAGQQAKVDEGANGVNGVKGANGPTGPNGVKEVDDVNRSANLVTTV